MRTMHRAAPCQCALRKVSIIYTKTLHSVLSSFTLSLVLLPSLIASTVHWLRCFLFLNAANRQLRSVLDSAKHVRCVGPAALSYPSSIVNPVLYR